MRRILLIGGNGFIGSHIKDSLLLNGLEVSVLDRFPERFRQPVANVQVVLGDHTDRDAVQRAFEGADGVVYLASTTVPQTSDYDPAQDVVENLVPFLGYLKLARRLAVKRFVHFSSGGTVYGYPTQLPVPETHPTEPVSAHGVLKLTMEKYLKALAHDSAMDAVILRVGNAYGERQNPFGSFGAVATFLGCFASRQPIHMWGDGETVRDYVYVRDVAAACTAALLTNGARGTYNIGTGQGRSLNDLLVLIAGITGQETPEVQRGDRRGFDIPGIVLDSTLAREGLGWQPATPLADGVRATWEWVRTLSLPAGR